MVRTRKREILCAVLFLLGSVLAPGHANTLEEGKPGPGDAAPRFTSVDLDGNRISLDGFLQVGNVVLLNFWGLRCANCITEIGYLNPMYERYRDEGVTFLGVNVDGVQPEIIRNMMGNLPHVPRFAVLPDPDFRIPEMYNMMGAPLSFVIGRDGKIVYRHEDFQPGDEKALEEALEKALPKSSLQAPSSGK